MAKNIMIQGTMSNAGKSLLAAGLCRIFRQDGYRVVPFKSQNMALNSYITGEGLEIGRAQAMQAQAAGIEPAAAMNPILLKPTNDTGSQVIVNGEVYADMSAREYFACKTKFLPEIRRAYDSLEAQYDMIVIEGAGSPAEINLKEHDIVNMGLAELVDAPVLLVGDIDRGGVFAQLAGTLDLLTPSERARVKGLVINKFRGDKSILMPGVSMLEERCGIPVVGVTPFLNVDLEDEDSLSERFLRCNAGGALDIAVVRLPHISNFTDFLVLENQEAVRLRYVERAEKIGQPDLVILPGTKNTMGDLRWLRESGMETAVLRAHAGGAVIFGICGGYQMLGEDLRDPDGVEEGGAMRGLGLLAVRTVFTEKKVRTRIKGEFAELSGALAELSGQAVEGYEMHMGESETIGGYGSLTTAGSRMSSGGRAMAAGQAAPLVWAGNLQNGEQKADGAFSGSVYGTYVHGIFDAEGVAPKLLRALARRKGITPGAVRTGSLQEHRDRQFDLLADALREHLDLEAIYGMMEWRHAGKDSRAEHMAERNGMKPVAEKIRPEGAAARMVPEKVRPADIEAKSFAMIEQELAAMGKILPQAQAPIIKRVIHTTADFSYADTLMFSAQAVRRALSAIREGACIVTDTQMAMSGINKRLLGKYGGEVFNFMADADVAKEAKERGVTRAAVCMERAAALKRPAIFAIGNAPTALVRLYEMIRDGKILPRFIIGVPVGFVNVVQAKELILDTDVPYIVARGRKGGSNVAAAICNALLYLLEREGSPEYDAAGERSI